jgi:hypothetical protein
MDSRAAQSASPFLHGGQNRRGRWSWVVYMLVLVRPVVPGPLLPAGAGASAWAAGASAASGAGALALLRCWGLCGAGASVLPGLSVVPGPLLPGLLLRPPPLGGPTTALHLVEPLPGPQLPRLPWLPRCLP